MYVIAGLGNPGERYEDTRHNTGRIVLGSFLKTFGFPDFIFNKKLQSLLAEAKVGKEKVSVIMPETYMNKSGSAVGAIITNKKKARELIVVHDDLDLPLGKIKISWNRGTGGHRGVLSIVRALKTEEFVRIRVGISPSTAGGKLRKPKGEREVEEFILGKFKEKEADEMKKISKKVSAALEMIILEGLSAAMSKFNS